MTKAKEKGAPEVVPDVVVATEEVAMEEPKDMMRELVLSLVPVVGGRASMANTLSIVREMTPQTRTDADAFIGKLNMLLRAAEVVRNAAVEVAAGRR